MLSRVQSALSVTSFTTSVGRYCTASGLNTVVRINTAAAPTLLPLLEQFDRFEPRYRKMRPSKKPVAKAIPIDFIGLADT
jgi:hypothetical protein